MTGHETKPEQGRASNMLLMFGCLGFFIIALSGIGIALEANGNLGRILITVYWVLAGAFFGLFIWAMRLRTCRFAWDVEGFSFCIGLMQATWHRYRWDDPVEYILYSNPESPDSKPGRPAFVFILITPIYEVRVDGMQMQRKTFERFLNTVKMHRGMSEFPFDLDMIDQGPLLRIRPSINTN